MTQGSLGCRHTMLKGVMIVKDIDLGPECKHGQRGGFCGQCQQVAA